MGQEKKLRQVGMDLKAQNQMEIFQKLAYNKECVKMSIATRGKQRKIQMYNRRTFATDDDIEECWKVFYIMKNVSF